MKILVKTHSDEISKIKKDKPKRKGNINGGFNKLVPVPELLVNYLDLTPGICLKRPELTNKLSDKFISRSLKHGQKTILDEFTIHALKLDNSYIDKEIGFGEFQTFLASFFKPKIIV
jgi:hypothetical protein